jgi:hypothetical protein
MKACVHLCGGMKMKEIIIVNIILSAFLLISCATNLEEQPKISQ